MIRPEGPNGHLNDDEYQAFIETLRTSHFMRIELRIKRRSDEKTIESLTAWGSDILSGAVQGDATADVTRTLQISLLDRRGHLTFQPNSASQASVYADKLLAIRYEVWVPQNVMTADFDIIPGIGAWISTKVFWGPLTSYSRTGPEVSLTAQGKESLGLDPFIALSPYTIHKGTKICPEAIKDVAGRFGEMRFKLPDLPHKLGRNRTVHSQLEPWRVLTNNKDLPGFLSYKRERTHIENGPNAGALTWKHADTQKVPGLIDQMPHGPYMGFYNGGGELEVRRVNTHPALHVNDAKWITSRPQEDFDTENFRNYDKVLGGAQKGHDPAQGHAALPPANPMSPDALSRTNWQGDEIPGRMAHVSTVDNLKSDDACDKRALSELMRMAQEGRDLSFDCFPIPMIEENDVITASSADFTIDVAVKQWTLPLTSDSAMSINRHSRVKTGRRRKQGGRRGSGRAGPGGPGGRGGHPGHGGSGIAHHHHHHHKHRRHPNWA